MLSLTLYTQMQIFLIFFHLLFSILYSKKCIKFMLLVYMLKGWKWLQCIDLIILYIYVYIVGFYCLFLLFIYLFLLANQLFQLVSKYFLHLCQKFLSDLAQVSF